MTNSKFIAIAGNIGSGKTTLTRMLSKHYSWEPHFEVVANNPYLSDFYGDMNRWSLQLQVFFLSKRFQAHQMIVKSQVSAIQDRSIYEDAHIFARALKEGGQMDERDYENYFELYSTMTQFLNPPDLVVYVKRSVPCLKERIKERGRTFEQNIPEDYLQLLEHCYEDWISEYQLGKVLVVNADSLDFKNNPKDFDYICHKIDSALKESTRVNLC
ncbi:MAG: deoxynucleoside kinase [Deltaproteobacteria bacterium]|nr:deoxynucleoside kinase [Deltaproteobacteria bacterium]MBM4316638.1 deoxynucleoside kinase [Deltaproteobacteria bacterium]